ncbi:MAG TPA: DUF6113 family protein [Mycobacteriales bacterium]|nr:DUF6113 family protein [Mycobacteriales bacterium]
MPSTRRSAPAVFALVLLLTVLLALWGAFLVPLRLRGVPVPVGIALALATVPLCRAGGRALGRRAGAAVPMIVWTAIAVALSTRRSEGDLVITGSLRGLAFLAVGLLGAAVAVGLWRPSS